MDYIDIFAISLSASRTILCIRLINHPRGGCWWDYPPASALCIASQGLAHH